jgi:hypothetical protein
MEDGIERSMSFLIAELEKKQQITRPKYEEQVHPIGLSLIGRSETTPIGHDNTPIGHDTTPIGHDNTPIGRQEACPKTSKETLAKTTPNLQSTNTGSDS